MKLHLADGLALPADEAVSQKYAFLGRSGSGKTYGAMKLAELFLSADAQVIALDWVGNWWALRLNRDGKSPGFEGVYIFGGEHADVPLEMTGGAMMADLLVDKHISAVLDLSPFRKGERTRFVTAFAEQLFHRKKTARTACHLFLEEAQAFLPQMVRGDDARMVGVFEDIGKVGRNYGIGVSILSQRPQAVNKDVLNQTEVLLAFQTNGPQERKTIGGWVVEHGDADLALVNELPSLPRGDAFVWSPQWLQIRKRVHVALRETYDGSSTPTQQAKRVKPTALTPTERESLGEAMKATVERAKAEDPKELRRQIAELKAAVVRLEKQPKPTNALERQPERVEVPVITAHDWTRLEVMRDEFLQAARSFEEHVQAAIVGGRKDLGASLSVFQAMLSPKLAAAAPPVRVLGGNAQRSIASPRGEDHAKGPRFEKVRFSGDRRAAARALAEMDKGTSLGKGERVVLAAVAQYPDGAARDQLTVLTGYKRSSRDTYLQRLLSRGYVDVNPNGAISVTDGGIAALGDDYEPLPTGRDLRQYWLDRLSGGERAILEVLVQAHGKAVTREDLDEATGYRRSSRDTYLQRLVSRRLVVVEGRGAVRASETLFE